MTEFWNALQLAKRLHAQLAANDPRYQQDRSPELDQRCLSEILHMLLDYLDAPASLCTAALRAGTASAEVRAVFKFLEQNISEPSAQEKALEQLNPYAGILDLSARLEEQQHAFAERKKNLDPRQAHIEQVWKTLPPKYGALFDMIWQHLHDNAASFDSLYLLVAGPKESVSRTTLRRRLSEMMTRKLLQHDHKKGGYYRPDSPPELKK
ncbi:MAG: hypothetical protein NTW87_11135 [Planctomycetota bacterium]|nr:hypothetical protein [Planctomycetota bacterium]